MNREPLKRVPCCVTDEENRVENAMLAECPECGSHDFHMLWLAVDDHGHLECTRCHAGFCSNPGHHEPAGASA